jgi:hypothetical protein
MKSLKSLILIAATFLLSAVSMAQTSYNNNYFGVSFSGGAVTTATAPNDARTSMNYDYISENSNVRQVVDVRLIDHDINVDLSSSNFYADQDNARGVVVSRSTGTYQGHPFTYTFTKITPTDGTAPYSVRRRYIIVGPRETIWIMQTSLMTFDDQALWENFENTLNIK